MIVMLTRLNEGPKRMCHCYWPTNSAELAPAATSGADHMQAELAEEPATPSAGNLRQTASLGGGAAQAPVQAGPTTLLGAAGYNGRRGSVTSVFAKLGPSGQPIIANGDLNNNVLVYDCSPAAAKLEVHLVSEHVSSDDYLVRNLYLVNQSTSETRAITQFHYLAWPESGVPENAKSLLEFRRKVHKSYRNLDNPILVHCSDGAGRSGTYTLIDVILERIKNGAKEIDPRATLEHLRDQRVGLCASQSQFEFVLVALAEEIQIILNALPQ